MSSMRFRRFAHAGCTFLFGWTLISAGPATLAGQDTTRVTTIASATMLRVLAETADQYRTGRRIFFVADYRFPHNVLGPFASDTEARRVQARSGHNFGVFGPYFTRPDSSASDSTYRVLSVTITVQTPEGRRDTILVDPEVDALFFTPTAIDKFLIPYYARIYGTEYASILRDEAMRPRKKPVCHLGSRACWPKPGGVEMIPIWDPVRGPLRAGPGPDVTRP